MPDREIPLPHPGTAIAAIVLFLASISPACAAGEVIERVETYAISGKSGAELYASIGERGPKIGAARVIAQTGFKLTWKRDYQQRGTDCVLASAVPRLEIITTLPKPAAPLSGEVAERWRVFIDGVTTHERVHGENLKVMAKEIEKATVGLSAEKDPDCNRLRAKMQPLLKEISQERQKKDRAFDESEFGSGGTIQKLVLELINGR